METMALGMLALIFLIVAVCCLIYQKTLCGLASSIVTIILTYLTGCSWKELLMNGGKDTALLGFQRYPAAPILLAILLTVAFVVLMVSIAWVARKNRK